MLKLVAVSVLLVAGLGAPAGATAMAGPGSAPTHQVPSQVNTVQAKDCGDWTRAVAGAFGKWAVSKSDCYVFGSPGRVMGYSWATQAGTNTRICVQGMGMKKVNGKTKHFWKSMGCGTSGGGTVKWGNHSDYPKVRATVQLGMLGGLYSWAH